MPGGIGAGSVIRGERNRGPRAVTAARAPASVLTALRYQPDQPALLTRRWTSDAVEAGILGSPVLSADGETVYVNGRDRRLWALNAADGALKWSLPLDFQPQTPPSVAPAG